MGLTQLVLTALNLTKSAYASFTFAANRFFSRFLFEGNAQYRERFYCMIYIKASIHIHILNAWRSNLHIQALLSVFRTRTGGDPTRDRDNVTTIERCDISIDDGPGKKSRFIAKIFCRNGMSGWMSY